ncbi:nuclear transport factor 2 family protein [Aquimarina sp. 2201CG5-10]|uniref:nuclear transport factor 2 family protein n=1 Tax=Aquimarina callyspongiae TaxID=3098150 RepID=UPI002AB3D809|nr:nuclear transport factor 2 family protein [Aquimarina sp. 2201CG5-10]MDY8135888.1 nuclear transport factor 2 family protein [Aquimarina sp. 2201CG5-10]
MNIKEQAKKMDAVVSTGAVVDAVKEFFADNATTSDHGEGGTTGDKAAMVAKMEGFVAGIVKVNGITLHHTIVDGNVSASEFTFDFDMQGGGKVYWHEIIRRIWNDEGKVIQEEYFNAE